MQGRRSKTGHLGSNFGLQDLIAFPLEPVAVATEDDDLGVMDQAIDHGGDGHGVAEDLRPGAEGLFEFTTRDRRS